MKTLVKQENLSQFAKCRTPKNTILITFTALFLFLTIAASSSVSAVWVAAYQWTPYLGHGTWISGGSSELLNSDNQYLVAQEIGWLDMQFDIRKSGSYSSVVVNFEVELQRPYPYWSIEVWVWTKSQTWQKCWNYYYWTSGTLAGGFSTSQVWYSMGYSSVRIRIICDSHGYLYDYFHFDRVRADF